MILLVCAVAQELAWFSHRPDVEILVTGVGQVESAARVAHALATRSYELVINAGIAGAFADVANVGAGVVVTEDFCELDIENGMPIPLPDGLRSVDRVRSDPELVRAVEARGFRAVRGITVSRVTATEATAARLHALGAEIETMEGFAALRAAAIVGVRRIEIRGISNIVGDRAQSRWDFAAGTAGLQNVMGALLAHLG